MLIESADAMEALGERLGRAFAHTGGCIALRGGLGAGKTRFVRGLARGAAVDDPEIVSSPTYVLLNIYPATPPQKTLYHLDAYRIASEEDFEAVGLPDLLSPENIVAIEWPERIESLLPPDRLEMTIERSDDENHREVTLTPTGPATAAATAGLGDKPA